MSGRVTQRVVGLAAAGVAAFVLLGGAPAGAGGTAAGWTALGGPYAPTEGIGEIGTAISCPTAASCAAVGYFSDTSDREEALVMDGSGSQWTPAEVTLPGGASTTAPHASLASVSCYSAGKLRGRWRLPDAGSEPNPHAGL